MITSRRCPTLPRPVTVTSVGTLAAAVTSIETSGGPFTYQTGDCYNQEPIGNVREVKVGFSPTVAGNFTRAH